MDVELKGKILVADDEKVNVEFFQVMLERLGFEVNVAYNGEEVIQRVKFFAPDIILLDLLMPKLNGIEVTKILKSNPETSNIPIIVLTAIDDIKEKVDLFEIGVEDYITKPFNFIEILARIRGILKTRRFKQLATDNEKKIDIFRDYFKKSVSLIERFGEILEKGKADKNSGIIESKNLFQELEKVRNEFIDLQKSVEENIEIY